MIPFILGIICGVALMLLIISIYAVMRASSKRSREEEMWDEALRCTMQGLQEKEAGMSHTLQELHRLEEEAVRREGKSEAGEALE